MSKKQNYNPFQGANFDKFNALKQQLERENARLLKERSNIQYQADNYDGPISQQTIIQRNQFSLDDEDQQQDDNIDLPRFQVNDRGYNSSYVKNSRKSVREQMGQKGQLLSDDVMEMIEEIQRKALAQIQSLRADKINLLRKLNKQIKQHNTQKKRSAQFERKIINSNEQIRRNATKSRQKPSQPKTPANIIYQEDEQNSPSPNGEYQQPQQNDRPIQDNFNNQQPQIPEPSGRQNYNYNGREIYQNNSQSAQSPIHHPQTVPSSRNPARLNNQNVFPAQSFYYLDRTPKPYINGYNSNPQVQLEQEINRLRNENAQIRNTISRSDANYANFPIKNQLRNQLNQLEARAQRYEQLIQKNRNMQTGPEGVEGSQVQTLLLQGAQITQQGQRLMKAKSNPQLRSSIGVNRNQFQSQLQNSRNMGRPNNNTRFSSGEYQSIISNMRRAANS